MTVSSTNPQFDKMSARWELVRDVLDSRVAKYIPEIDKSDSIRNAKYVCDAQFTNFTARTKSGLVGAVFRKDLVLNLPDDIEYAKDDVTGSNMGLSKLAQEVTGEVISCGRYGLLCDYPAVQDNLTLAEVENSNLKARIYRYKAENIINWQTKMINGYPTLSLVVLQECMNTIDELDGFKWVESIQYRVLRLVEGIYVQQVYNEDEELISSYIPTGADGLPFNEIPFIFVGSEDNDSEVDTIPLYDIARLNIGHFKNSADYEESVHIVGQPTLIISTSMSKDEFDAANPNGVLVGSRRGHNLGEGGSAQLLQPSPNQLADVAMQRKEEQAVMIGARLITKQADRETAEAAVMRTSGENSILYTIAGNVEEALNRACRFLMRFMSLDVSFDDDIVKINKLFFDKNVDPQVIMAQIQLLDKQLISKKDVRDTLRAYGLVAETRTDENIDSDIGSHDDDVSSPK